MSERSERRHTSGFPEKIERGFAGARRIADAVLMAGYELHPHRVSEAENRLRRQFGVLVPPEYTAQGGEHSHQRTECVMEAQYDDRLAVELRFLRAQRRTVEQAVKGGGFEPVEELELADRVLVECDEAVEERIELLLSVEELTGEVVQHGFRLPGVGSTELLHERGSAVGRLVRRREQVDGLVRLRVEELPGRYRAQRLTVEVENASTWTPPRGAGREEALPRSLLSTHLLLALEHGRFLSVADPPDWARSAVERCRNERTWPMPAGPDGGYQVVLSSPILLEDHPPIPPESPDALYEATEIDEIRALRTATPTDRRKREPRGSDGLAASMPPEVLG
ncbi:hypothetical protein AB0F92_21165 [Kitasatospora aureofaciens]|uniref:hypothetical protein n=1 Tax=Kitasatospora aureofaciens TaxID=1894 RepID=UPI000AD0DBAE